MRKYWRDALDGIGLLTSSGLLASRESRTGGRHVDHDAATRGWFGYENERFRHACKRSQFGKVIADAWRQWEWSGRAWLDPDACQIDHVRLVQSEIMRSADRRLIVEPTDLDRYALPWYAKLSMFAVRTLERFTMALIAVAPIAAVIWWALSL